MQCHLLIKLISLSFVILLTSCSYPTILGEKFLPDAEYNTLLVKADAAMQDGQLARAADLYEKAGLLKPENWDLKLKQAKAYQLDGKLAQAFNTYQLIVEAKSLVNAETFKAAKEGQDKLGFKNVAAVTPVEAVKDVSMPTQQVNTEDAQASEPTIATQPIPEQSLTADDVVQVREQVELAADAEDKRILDELNAWSEAWAAKKLDAYFAHYVDGFAGDMSNAKAWQLSRKHKILRSKQIKIALSEIKIYKLENSVELVFKQNYQSDNFQDVGRKTLVMIQVKGRWLIKKELFN